MPKRSAWRVVQFDTLRLRLIKLAAPRRRAEDPDQSPPAVERARSGDLRHDPRPAAPSRHLINRAGAPERAPPINLHRLPDPDRQTPPPRVWAGSAISSAHNQSGCEIIYTQSA
jgi:hypothetical protein